MNRPIRPLFGAAPRPELGPVLDSESIAYRALVPPSDDECCWETYHDNSKTERHDRPPPNDLVRARMAALAPALAYEGYPTIALPPPPDLTMPIGAAIRARVTGRDMASCALDLDQVSALLFNAYGETRDNAETTFPRPFRTVPSGGALYPLDLYLHSARIAGAPPGLYYYDPTRHQLRLVRRGDQTHKLSGFFVQPELPLNSAAQLFITAFFERSTFKYRDRGYRFALLEAGHVAQNFNLAGTALGLAVTCVGGYFDRDVDDFLQIDGITRSTIYAQVVGGRGIGADTTHW
ncbi:SagB/ThcOx family dehydrogenase [Sphingomonas sp. 28-63-12]|uniref:SagB/ThcOx family dehydrogenase n=1 Tax=Sphingomonas sp. 28-63-12 TaxID=1970434 RepID=UPI000BD5D1E3|nr:MAG: hypothetical protein B7Y47_12000 [Sphingomonas sp. 28-63-12]